jgi:hypothetical protein
MAVPATSPPPMAVDITGEEPAAVDEAREQQRGANDGLLGVNVAAVLARRDGPPHSPFAVPSTPQRSDGRASTG